MPHVVTRAGLEIKPEAACKLMHYYNTHVAPVHVWGTALRAGHETSERIVT